MNLTHDANLIYEQMKRDTKPASKMECGLEVISFMNATNNAIDAYNLGRKSAMGDRRFYLVTSILNGYIAKWGCSKTEEDGVIEKAFRIADKTIKKLNEIEQKEFDDFKNLK